VLFEVAKEITGQAICEPALAIRLYSPFSIVNVYHQFPCAGLYAPRFSQMNFTWLAFLIYSLLHLWLLEIYLPTLPLPLHAYPRQASWLQE